MNKRIDIASGFSLPEIELSERIDFSHARRLETETSAYLLYVVEIRGRKLLVKRLSERNSAKPIYISALKKEFEIGRSLSHPSLPVYLWSADDYIVSDYIEGESLSTMIKNGDPWLKNTKNIGKLFRQLLEVVNYLHRNNIIHCDIKPGNIIVTAATSNIVLIDFDKCHAPWYAGSSGDPTLYGLSRSEKGNPRIDFNGIAAIVDILLDNVEGLPVGRLRKLKSLCLKDGSDADSIISAAESISRMPTKKFRFFLLLSAVLVITVPILLFFNRRHAEKPDYPIAASQDALNQNDTPIPAPQPSDTVTPVETTVTPTVSSETLTKPTDRPSSELIIEKRLTALTPFLVTAKTIAESRDSFPADVIDRQINLLHENHRRIEKEIITDLQADNLSLSENDAAEILSRSPLFAERTDTLNALVAQLKSLRARSPIFVNAEAVERHAGLFAQ